MLLAAMSCVPSLDFLSVASASGRRKLGYGLACRTRSGAEDLGAVQPEAHTSVCFPFPSQLSPAFTRSNIINGVCRDPER